MSFDVVQFSRVLSDVVHRRCPFAIVTLVEIRGSAPQIVGARAIITSDGLEAGTVGGGRMEAAAIRHAQQCLADAQRSGSELVTWNLQTDIGMTCGGEVRLLFDFCGTAAWPLAVYGAGHIAQALVPLLLQLHCQVTCIDSRADWLERLPDDPKLTKIRSDDLPSTVSQRPPGTWFLLMTQGHATDLPVLAEILRSRVAPYVGVIGSRQKAKVLRRDLQQQGIPMERIDAVFCPMGLALGNNTPPEIAISVAAQLLQRRDERDRSPAAAGSGLTANTVPGKLMKNATVR